jgi:hypothetical protein
VNPNSGRIEFAVISLTGGADSGKLTALPWPLIKTSGQGATTDLTANVDKNQISTAQTFDQTQWPDMSQPNWSQSIYSHYGIQRQRGAMGGRSPFGGSDTGTGTASPQSPSSPGTEPGSSTSLSTSPGSSTPSGGTGTGSSGSGSGIK